jgi:hypothetical protein
MAGRDPWRAVFFTTGRAGCGVFLFGDRMVGAGFFFIRLLQFGAPVSTEFHPSGRRKRRLQSKEGYVPRGQIRPAPMNCAISLYTNRSLPVIRILANPLAERDFLLII